MGKLFVVEGLDGLGKTTLAKELASSVGGRYVKADHSLFKSLDSSVVENMHPMRRFLYYLSSYHDISEMVRKAPPSEVFVTDRYVPSMCVYNGKLAGRDLKPLIDEFDFLVPEQVFHLVGDESDRWNRVEIRTEGEKSDWDKKIQSSENVKQDIISRYNFYCSIYPKILSTGRDLKDVVLELTDYVEGNFADLHIHSSIVDGDLSPEEIVKNSELIGLKAISITDHESVEAYDFLPETDIDIITGVEISTKYEEFSAHIMGYGFDLKNSRLLETLEVQRKSRENWFYVVCGKLNDLGFTVDPDKILEYSTNRFLGKGNIIYEVFTNGENNEKLRKYTERYPDMNEGIDAFIMDYFEQRSSPIKDKVKRISAPQAIEVISQAGGISVLGHPKKFLKGPENDGYVEHLSSIGLDGLECFSSHHSYDDVAHYLLLANRLGLKITGGSDYHVGWRKDINQINDFNLGTGITGNARTPLSLVRRLF